MRTREHDWYDAERHRPVYGVDIYVIGRGWMPAGSGKGPTLFDCPYERDAERARLRKMPAFRLAPKEAA